MKMKRIGRAAKIGAGALFAAVLSFSLLAVFPAAGAETGEEAVEVMSSEAVILDTNHKGAIEKGRVITYFGLKGEGEVDVRKDMSLQEGGNWQGVKSFTTPVVEGDQLVWKGLEVKGNANYLSSVTLEEEQVREVRMRVPLDIEYIYEWNGEIISDPNEKTGQDGHFKLYLRMKNTSKERRTLEYEDPETGEIKTEEVDTYLPLVILPYDWYFDNDVFFDLKADPTGVVVELPEHYQVGWSIPLFPPATEESHTIWVEADVKNFSMPPLVLSANFIFPQTNQRDTLPEFIIGLKMLFDGVRQIRDGLGSAETENTLLYGIHAISDGLQQMASGLPEAQAALEDQLIPGVEEAVAGIGDPGTPDTLSYAIDATSVGLTSMLGGIGGPDVANTALYAINAMSQGLREMAAGIGSSETPDTLLYGVDQASAGLQEMAQGIGDAAMQDTLLYAMNEMRKGLTQIKAGIGAAGADPSLLFAMNEMKSGLREASQGIGSAGTPDTLLYGIAAMADGLQQILDGIGSENTRDTLLYGVSEVTKGVSSGDPSNPGLLEGIQELKAGVSEMYAQTSVGSELWSGLELIRVLAFWTGPIVDQLEQGLILSTDPDDPSMHYGLGMMLEGLEDMISGIGSARTPDTLLYGLNEIRNGLREIKEGIGGEEKLLYAAAQIRGGLEELKRGIGDIDQNPSLLFAVNEVEKGLEEIRSGIGDPTTNPSLLYAVAQVENGLKLMKAGIGSANKEDTLLYAMSAMGDGLMQIKEGIGSETTADSLLYALAQVGNGLELMKSGIGAEGAPNTLLYAMAQVQHGLYRMKTGLSSGDMNDPGLKEGLMLISSGLGEAVSGLGSTTTPDTLLYGADQVESGLKRISEEGINAMYEGLAGNLADLYLTESQLEAIKQRGEEFDHILGRAEDAENNLAFIYQTPATYNYGQGSKKSWAVAGIVSLLVILAILSISVAARRRPVLG
ncbi:MAG: hypothetical protein HPY75_05635 [Actinobacteria bacterium]|nr:hypothetical protein [Actinomycetota bacterium]